MAAKNVTMPKFSYSKGPYQFELDLKAVSLNKYYGVWGNRIVTSKVGKAFRKQAQFQLRELWKRKPLTSPVKLKLEFHYKKHPLDVDNGVKGVFDSLSKLVIKDDKQIMAYSVKKFVKQPENLIVITLYELEEAGKSSSGMLANSNAMASSVNSIGSSSNTTGSEITTPSSITSVDSE